jgi:hypothetical protein
MPPSPRPRSGLRRHSRPSLSRPRSNSWDHPIIGSPRTPLPPETNAVSYDPSYLTFWAMPPDLRNALPKDLHQHITYLQEAGAAVQTGLHRLDLLKASAGDKVVETDDEEDVGQPTQGNTSTNNQSFLPEIDSLETLRTPSLTSLPSIAASPFSSRSNSMEQMNELEGRFALDVRIASTRDASPHGTPITPLELSPETHSSPFAAGGKIISRRVSEAIPLASNPLHAPRLRRSTTPSLASHSFSSSSDTFVTPARTPIIQRWRAELSYLRETTLPRLRHALRKVNGEWRVYTSHHGALAERHYEYPHLREAPGYQPPPMVSHPAEWEAFKEEMGSWLESMKRRVGEIEARDAELEGGVVLGWGTRERGSPSPFSTNPM